MIFNVAVAFMVFFAASGGTAQGNGAQHKLARSLLAILPDLGAFNVADDINLGNGSRGSMWAMVAVDGLVYVACDSHRHASDFREAGDLAI